MALTSSSSLHHRPRQQRSHHRTGSLTIGNVIVELHHDNENHDDDEESTEKTTSTTKFLNEQDNADGDFPVPPSPQQQQQHLIDDCHVDEDALTPAILLKAIEKRKRHENGRDDCADDGAVDSTTTLFSKRPVAEMVALSVYNYPNQLDLDLLYQLTSAISTRLSPSFDAAIILWTDCRLLRQLEEEQAQEETEHDVSNKYDEKNRTKLLSNLQIRCIESISIDLRSFYIHGLTNIQNHLDVDAEEIIIRNDDSKSDNTVDSLSRRILLLKFIQELPRHVVIAMISRICSHQETMITGEECYEELVSCLAGLIRWRVSSIATTAKQQPLKPSSKPPTLPKSRWMRNSNGDSNHRCSQTTNSSSSSSFAISSCSRRSYDDDDGDGGGKNRLRFNSSSCVCPDTIEQPRSDYDDGYDIDKDNEEEDIIMGLSFLDNNNKSDQYHDQHRHRPQQVVDNEKEDYYCHDPAHKPPVEYIYVVRCTAASNSSISQTPPPGEVKL